MNGSLLRLLSVKINLLVYRLHKYEAVLAKAQTASRRIQAQARVAHHAAYEARHTARRIAIGADEARGQLAAVWLCLSAILTGNVKED